MKQADTLPTDRDGKLELHLDASSFTPYYQQIIDQIRALVRTRSVREGDTFLSEGEIAATLGISKMPIRQAFLKLRSEGLLVIERGKRPVIGSEKVSWNFQQLRGFSEEMRRRGLTPSNTVLSLTTVAADHGVAKALRLRNRQKVYRLERLYYVDEEPVAIVTSYLPINRFSDLDRQHLENASLYEIFEKIYGVELNWAEEEIGAVNASAEDARILRTEIGMALLTVHETTFDSTRAPVEFSRSLLRADRYKATLVSVRNRSRR